MYDQIISEWCTLVLSCTILCYLNLFYTIFCCSRFVRIIHHLQDGLRCCCLVWRCLRLLARFHKRIPEGHSFHVFLQAFGNLPCSYLHFSFGAESSIDNPWQSLVSSDVLRICQNAQWWYITTMTTYHAETCIQLFCTQLPFCNYSGKNSTKDRNSNQFSCFSITFAFLQKNVWLNFEPNQTHWKHLKAISKHIHIGNTLSKRIKSPTTFEDTKGCHGWSMEPSAPEEKCK